MLSPGKNVLVITYWNFRDALIQTYTLPYLRLMLLEFPAEARITLLTLETEPLSPEHRQIKESLRAARIDWISARYRPFGFGGILMWLALFLRLTGIILTRKINVVHCWGMTAGAAGCLLAMITGRRLVIDSYEPHAEAMVENGTWHRSGLAFRILFFLETLQSRRADVVISATAGMRAYALEKYKTDLKNFEVKPACVDLSLFSSANVKNQKTVRELGYENKIVCVYAGKFGGIYLGREAFDFLKVAHVHFGPSFRILLLTNHAPDEIEKYCIAAGLDFGIVTVRFVPHHEVPDFMGVADFAISPVKPVPTKRFCTPIKDGEYWALGLPIVIPDNISDDSEIIRKNLAGAILSDFSNQSFEAAAQTIEDILTQPKEKTFLRIRSLAEQYRSFSIAQKVYKNIYGKWLKVRIGWLFPVKTCF